MDSENLRLREQLITSKQEMESQIQKAERAGITEERNLQSEKLSTLERELMQEEATEQRLSQQLDHSQ